MTIERFGHTADGREVQRVQIGSAALTAKILTMGAILQDVRLAGVPHALTLGTDSLAPYEGGASFHGSIAGPVANRIGQGKAMLDGRVLTFEPGHKGHTIHSGPTGTHHQIWEIAEATPSSVALRLSLADGLGGFPGNREITASLRVDGARLTLEITGQTDAPTFLNLANHSYWNLDGAGTTSGHTLEVAADEVLETDETVLPTGRLLAVEGTHFDFRTPRPLPNSAEARLDTNFCLARARRNLSFAARLTGASGIAMTMETTEPGLQVYDGHPLSGPGRDGAHHIAYGGVALEAQCWPDAPNQPSFPSIRLAPGETYHQVTRFTFAAR